jgi:hypothetical protein
MGTRNLTAVVLNGEFKIAQYGQWDGYPSGQGDTICKFLQSGIDLEKFKQAVSECKFLTKKEVENIYNEVTKPFIGKPVSAIYSGSLPLEIADEFNKQHFELSRNAAAEILDLVYSKGVREIENSLDFAADSLFCEWAYVLDLDNEKLEVYQGFNKTPLTDSDRFYFLQDKSEKGYFPVKKIAEYPISEATVEAMTELERVDEEAAEATA